MTKTELNLIKAYKDAPALSRNAFQDAMDESVINGNKSASKVQAEITRWYEQAREDLLALEREVEVIEQSTGASLWDEAAMIENMMDGNPGLTQSSIGWFPVLLRHAISYVGSAAESQGLDINQLLDRVIY